MNPVLRAIVTRGGKVLITLNRESSILMMLKHFNLENIPLPSDSLAVANFYCNHPAYDDPESYSLTVRTSGGEESSSIKWWTPDLEDYVRSRFKEYLSQFIIRESRSVLLGGIWILGEGVHIEDLFYGEILAMCDKSVIDGVRERSLIHTMVGHSHIHFAYNSSILTMQDQSRINHLASRSTVELMTDHANISRVGGSSVIGVMRGNSNINLVFDYALVETMVSHAQIVHLSDHARVICQGPTTTIHQISDQASVILKDAKDWVAPSPPVEFVKVPSEETPCPPKS